MGSGVCSLPTARGGQGHVNRGKLRLADPGWPPTDTPGHFPLVGISVKVNGHTAKQVPLAIDRDDHSCNRRSRVYRQPLCRATAARNERQHRLPRQFQRLLRAGAQAGQCGRLCREPAGEHGPSGFLQRGGYRAAVWFAAHRPCGASGVATRVCTTASRSRWFIKRRTWSARPCCSKRFATWP